MMWTWTRARSPSEGRASGPVCFLSGRKAIKTLDRYLRVRGRHPRASAPWLFVGARGRLTDSGVRQILKRRSRQACIEPVHPHQLRHTFAHAWLSGGGTEGGLMRITGWRSRQDGIEVRGQHRRPPCA
jgi:integrase